LALALLLFAITLSPLIERLQWPFLQTFSTTWPSAATLRSERDRYKQELDGTREELEIVKQDLAVAQHPPENPANTRTWLRLNFNEKGEPDQISGPNVHWSWMRLPELPNGIALDFFESAGSLSGIVEPSTLLFLSFDAPIRSDPVVIGPDRASLPQLDTITPNDRQIILRFHGQIINRRLDIVIKR
jgi:hypothetical protein